MKKWISFFRFQSIMLLAAYLSCLLLPPTAKCEQTKSRHEFRKLLSEDTSEVSLILRYSVDRPARSMIFEVAASTACSNHDAFNHRLGLSLVGGMGAGGKHITGTGRLRTAGNISFIEHSIGQTDVVEGDSESKKWYKKWWIIGLGAAALTGTVLLIVSGGDDSEPVADLPLPGFPDPPMPAFR